MKYLALCLLLVGCGNNGGSSTPVPASLLIGQWNFVGATAQISATGTFTLNQYSPTVCVEGGTYQDMNPGSNNGQVLFTNTTSNCAGTFAKSLDSYIIANGSLILTLITH